MDSIDSALILQYEAGLISLLPNAPSADVTRDGSVNSVDALLVLQNQAGLVAQLHCASGAGASQRAPVMSWAAWRLGLRR